MITCSRWICVLLCWASWHCSVPMTTVEAFAPTTPTTVKATALSYANDGEPTSDLLKERQRQWLSQSLSYYSKVSREERRRRLGQLSQPATKEEHYHTLANQHYFAIEKVRHGQWEHAELIYRRIVQQILRDEGHCDHASLAVTTLLLALLLQRTKDAKKTRAVFVNFVRVMEEDPHEQDECACSAKVLQAYALFEMKQGNAMKSLQLVQRAVRLDPSLEPVLQWKQFREVSKRKQERQQQQQSSS